MSQCIKYLTLIICLFCISKQSFSQLHSYRFEEIDSLQKIEKRPLLVFIHTSWCQYCALMKNTTFKNTQVIELLNKKYYFIDFNAEEKRSITFNGTTFRYKPNGFNTGINQLAIELAAINGKLSYPTLCFLNSDYEITYQVDFYINSSELINIIHN